MRNLEKLDEFRKRNAEKRFFGEAGNEYNGVFEIRVGAKWFYCIATNSNGLDHVSVSPVSGNGTPTWSDMCKIKELFFEDEEEAVQFHPRKSECVNQHPHCLHLWRPNNQELVRPSTDKV